MRHKHDGRAFRCRDDREFFLQSLPRHRIDSGEGLIHEQNGRVVGEHASNGCTLPHAARELVRILTLESGKPDEVDEAPSDARPLFAGDAFQTQAELDIGLRRLPRQQRILLEDHATVRTRPRDLSRPATMRRKVDFPQPEGPMTDTNSCALMLSEMASNAWTFSPNVGSK